MHIKIICICMYLSCICFIKYIALDLVFTDGIQSQCGAEFITIPLLDGGCETSVNSENKVHCVHVHIPSFSAWRP